MMTQRMRGLMIGLLLILTGQQLIAQVYLKAEYMGNSSFRDDQNVKTGGKGSAKVLQGGINIPFAVKINENNRPRAWSIGIGGSYTSLKNNKLEQYITLKEIMNVEIGLSHIRPLNDKISLLASLGAGLYMDDRNISNASFSHILGSGGAIVIWHLRPNLDLGGGLALNTTFGFPMVFPAIYFNWKLEGKYEVNISMLNAVELSAGMKMNKYINLNLVAEMSGSLALTKEDGKKKMFTHQYIVTGLQPEIKITPSLSLPITIGMTADRIAYSQERTLKAFFKDMGKEYDPHFSPSFYIGGAIKYGF